jgi:hypothetical protein
MPSDGTPRPEQLAWLRASFCANRECVEVAQRDGEIVLRDSKDPHGHVLRYTADEWRSFVRGIKAGEFDDLGT